MFKNKKRIRESFREEFGKFKLEEFNFDAIEKYFRRKDNTGAFQVLSDKTCNDLDINDFFTFIDRTQSRVGQQYLYNKLHVIPNTYEHLEVEERIIDKINRNEELRINTQKQLSCLKKDEAYYICSLFQHEHIKPPKWYFIVPVLSFGSLLSLILFPFNGQFIFAIIAFFLINAVIHYWNKKNLFEYLNSLPQLLRLNKVARILHANEIFSALNPNLKSSIATINEVKNRMAFFNLESKVQGDAEVIFWGVMELFKTFFLLEPLLLFGVLKRLDTKRKQIEEVFTFVGQVDALISIASLRKGLECYCFPEIANKAGVLETSKIYHPLIENCVDNDIQIQEKSVLLTGSNMSGKTSFIRAIAINVIAGLTLNTCFANKFSFSKMRVFSAIRISDDLLNDKSYYFEEVLTIKEMIKQSKSESSNLFLLDEIFKGTNTIERISAGKAVLSELARKNMVFVSTHDIELADLLKQEYDLYHFSEIVNQKTVDFDYKLKKGKLKNRNAIRILEINDYPQSVITEANDLSKELDNVSATQVN